MKKARRSASFSTSRVERVGSGRKSIGTDSSDLPGARPMSTTQDPPSFDNNRLDGARRVEVFDDNQTNKAVTPETGAGTGSLLVMLLLIALAIALIAWL